MANGTHTLLAKAYDAAGNSTMSAANTVTVNNQVVLSGPWAKGFCGTSYNYGQAVAVEHNTRNIVFAGAFGGITDFGGGLLTSAGGMDMVLAKYSPTGAHLWSKRFGSTGNEMPVGTALDASGNIFVTGSFSGTADFGGGPMTSAGVNDIFLAKYSSTGQFQWVKQFGGAGDDQATAIAIDRSGNVVLAGAFSSKCDQTNFVTYGGISFGGSTFCSGTGGLNLFVAKFSGADGSHLWSRDFSTQGQSQGKGVAVDGNGDVFVVGSVQGSMDFGNGRLYTMAALGAFAAKLSGATGSVIWSKLFGGQTSNYNDQGVAVAIDSVGNIFFTGSFASRSIDFGCGPLSNSSYDDSVFLAKLSGSDGSCMWARASTSTSGSYADPLAVAVDASDNVEVAGVFKGNVTFAGTTLTTTCSREILVAKYSGSGSFQWVNHFGGSTTSDLANSHAIATDGSGNIIVTGQFLGTVNFGGTILTSHSSYDALLLRLNP